MHAESETTIASSFRDARNRVERALGVFTDVRPGEATIALLLLANLFVALFAYYLLKTLREPLVLASGGATWKSYAAGAQAFFLLLALPIYARLARRVSPRRLAFATTLIAALVIEVFAVLARFHVPNLGFAFFVFVGIFGVFSVAQLWSFATDLHDEAVGLRLFPLVHVGATVGSAAGALVASRLFAGGMPIGAIFHLAAGFVLVQAALYAAATRSASRTITTASSDAPLAGRDGFSLVLGSSRLRLLALALVLASLVNTNGEFLLSGAVIARAEEAFALAGGGIDRDAFVHAYVGGFYGNFFLVVNVVTVVLQALVASRLVRFGGLRAVLLAAPLVAVATYGLAASALGFVAFRIAKTVENACDYSLGNTAKALVYLPLPRDEKYKAKQVVDTFFVRFGDVTSALVVFALVEKLAVSRRALASVNVVLAVGVVLLLAELARRHRADADPGIADPS